MGGVAKAVVEIGMTVTDHHVRQAAGMPAYRPCFTIDAPPRDGGRPRMRRLALEDGSQQRASVFAFNTGQARQSCKTERPRTGRNVTLFPAAARDEMFEATSLIEARVLQIAMIGQVLRRIEAARSYGFH